MPDGGLRRPFVMISAGGKKKLVPLDDVVELVPMLALTPVEGSAGACRGMANLRGEIVPVFDMTSPTAPLHPSRFIVVVRTEPQLLGLIVDDVHDIVSLGADEIASRPVGGGRFARVARVDDGLLSVVEPAGLLERYAT